MASTDIKKRLERDYSEALEKSPRWIKMAFAMFLTMPDRVVSHKPFLYFVLGTGTMDFKMTKEMAQYGESREGQRCDNCRFAYQKVINNKRIICSQMRGGIRPEKWCKLWRA
jgi:hypothetical protein